MTTNSFTVKGMTCGHCVGAVKEEVGQLSGVLDVAIDLPTGRVTVTSETVVDLDTVRGAVEEAGYELAS